MISIALTTYNGSKYIREQIDSIINQNFSDWELIVCDDKSTDNTVEILNEYEKKDSRIHIYLNEKNLGFKKNFEKAISLCNGEYIALCDQDDVWTTNHIEKLYNQIQDFSISCGNAEMIDSKGVSLNKNLSDIDNLYSFDSKSIIYKILFQNNAFQGASMLIKASFLKKYGKVPDSIKFHDVWYACCACLDGGITYTFDVITKYRQHGNNVTFQSHNKTHGIVSKYVDYFKKLFSGTYSDRFEYYRQLDAIFGFEKNNLQDIEFVFRSLLNKKNRIKLMKWCWNNYNKISTRNNHKNFFKFYTKLIKWKDEKHE